MFGHRAVALALGLGCVLISVLPWPLPGATTIAPMPLLGAVYYWTVHRPELMPPGMTFFLGTVQDVLTGGPLGLTALILVAAQLSLAGQARALSRGPFPLDLLGFAATAVVFAALNWLATSIYFGSLLSPEPLGPQILLGLCLYPVLNWFLGVTSVDPVEPTALHMIRREGKRFRTVTRRAFLLGAVQTAAFGVLAARMYQLQVSEADRYATLAEDNRVSPRLIPPERGVVVDRFGVPLAVNRQTYRIVVVPEQAGNLDRILTAINELVSIPEHEWNRVMRTARRMRGFMPLPVIEDLSWEEIARVAVHAPDLPGVQIEVVPRRIYPESATMAHLVGYVGAVAEDDLTGDPLLSMPGFKIGKAGMEKTHELPLRGKAGLSEVEVNAVGRVIRELRRTEGRPGRELMLTVDTELQKLALDRFGAETGAAVVMDVHTGEILAMASRPTFDPNPFPRGIGGAEWRRLTTHPHAPLTNKAIAGHYAPGSTFKMVTAMAAMEAGIKPHTTVSCSGSISLGDSRFHCWRRGGHGTLNMTDALVQSCDVYFYEMAGRIGIDKLAVMGRRLGVGVRLGIDLPSERDGLMPTQAWKRGATGKPWVKGETLIAGIGQGYVLATPLQLAVMTARLVNGGRAVKPVLTRALGSEGRLVAAAPGQAPSLGLSVEALGVVNRGMAGVVNGARGTARAARIETPGMEMGGKTGTAQVRRITMAERRTGVRKNADLERESRDHALFVGYAPVTAPRYVVSVIVEHGGGGSAVAAPIARDILIETQTRDPTRRAPPTLQVSDIQIQPAMQRVKL